MTKKSPRHTHTPMPPLTRCKHGMVKQWCHHCNSRPKQRIADLSVHTEDDEEEEDMEVTTEVTMDDIPDDLSILDLIELFELWDSEDIPDDEDIYNAPN